MAEKTALECNACGREIEKHEVEVLLLGVPTGAFDDQLRPIFAPVHACKGCADTLTLAQLRRKLRAAA